MRTFPMATASLLAAVAALPARASAQDVDAMAKWTSYAVVHYHYVGTYSGETKVLVGTQGLHRVAAVTDRVEIDFDWDQNEMKVAGTPVIKNFPSTVGTPLPVNQCPPPRIEGAFELATVTGVTDMGGTILTLANTRRFPPGAIPVPGEQEVCGEKWETVTTSMVTSDNMVQVPPAMMLAMPGAGAFAVTPDGKSIKINAGNTGLNASGLNDWIWIITPTPVK